MGKIWYIIYSVMDLEPELDTVTDLNSFVFPCLLDQDLDYVFGLQIQISIGLPP
jgi:hypothetical protein